MRRRTAELLRHLWTWLPASDRRPGLADLLKLVAGPSAANEPALVRVAMAELMAQLHDLTVRITSLETAILRWHSKSAVESLCQSLPLPRRGSRKTPKNGVASTIANHCRRPSWCIRMAAIGGTEFDEVLAARRIRSNEAGRGGRERVSRCLW